MNSNCIKLIGMSCISAILASEPYMSATAAESQDTQPASIKLQPITVYSAVAGDGQLVAPLDILAPLNQESYTQKSIGTFGRQGNINVFKVIELNVIKWDIDHEIFGAVLEYEKYFSKELNTKLGYWTHRQLPPGPPSDQKKYTASANGLTFAGYAVLADNNYHDFNSPFTELSGRLGNFVYSAGVRYLNFKVGEITSYTNGTNAATSQDYDTAIANGTFDPWASVDAKYYREWLPSTYLGYNMSTNATVYADYTRTYGLDVNLFPAYVQQRANFVTKGVSLPELWDKLDLEIADNFDLGVKYKIRATSLIPWG
jgi:hypothetical protein